MRKLLLASFLLLGFLFMNAQGITYGLKAGLNLSNWSTSNSDMSDYISGRTSFHAGGVFEIPVSDKFSVQPEILYSSIGGKVDYSVMTREDSSNLIYMNDYLTIPVMAKYYVADGFSLEVGPQIAFLLSAKAKYNGETADMKDLFESTDFGAGVGAGYKLENGLFFNARYVFGLTNIAKEMSDGDWVKNNVFQFSLGYMFK